MRNEIKLFNKYVQLKKMYVRANESPIMTKQPHKEIMKRSSLRNFFLNNKTDQKKIKRLNCKTRKFLKTTKKSCFFTLDTKKLPKKKR